MKAQEELRRLQQKLESGDLPPDEPLFVLRAQDRFAADTVRAWVDQAVSAQIVPSAKLVEAERLAAMMDRWPVKQTPGRAETRRTASPDTPSGEG